MTSQITTQTTWPGGVIARYLTVGGATVDVSATEDNRGAATCGGCPQTLDQSSYYSRSLGTAHHWAQEHAETCRAMPRPAA